MSGARCTSQPEPPLGGCSSHPAVLSSVLPCSRHRVDVPHCLSLPPNLTLTRTLPSSPVGCRSPMLNLRTHMVAGAYSGDFVERVWPSSSPVEIATRFPDRGAVSVTPTRTLTQARSSENRKKIPTRETVRALQREPRKNHESVGGQMRTLVVEHAPCVDELGHGRKDRRRSRQLRPRASGQRSCFGQNGRKG